jgi:hypothetical protein
LKSIVKNLKKWEGHRKERGTNIFMLDGEVPRVVDRPKMTT